MHLLPCLKKNYCYLCIFFFLENIEFIDFLKKTYIYLGLLFFFFYSKNTFFCTVITNDIFVFYCQRNKFHFENAHY